MSNTSQNSRISLLSGRYHGRVLEVLSRKDKSQVFDSENTKNILVLIKDRLYTLNLQEDAELTEGVLISFEVTEKGGVVNLKSRARAVNIEADGDLLRWRSPAKNPSRMKLLRTLQ